MKPTFGQREAEALDLLVGNRNRVSMPAAAVRIEDMAGLLDVGADLRARSVTTAPTAEDFNQVVRDLADVHACLRTLAQAIQDRLAP